MTRRRAWLTPDASEEAVTIVRPLFIPLPFLPMVAGALAELTDTWNWEQKGTINPNDAAQEMAVMLHNWVDAGVGAMSLFRFTEECSFEFSNDNGVTWLVVPGWNEYAATCFTTPETPGILATVVNPLDYDDPPALNFNAGTKTLTLDIPTGHPPETPGILITEVQHHVGDTPTSMLFNAAEKKLTLFEQQQWIRGFRTTGTNPTHLQINSYQNPDEWTTIALLPQWYDTGNAPPAGAIDEPPVTGLTNEQICGMATMIMQSIEVVWNQNLEQIENSANAIEAIGEGIEWFYAAGIPIAFQGLADILTSMYTITAATLRSSFTPAQYDTMLGEMYCLLKAAGGYDWAAIIQWRDWANNNYNVISTPGAWSVANQVTFLDASWLKRKAYLGTLDPLATCALYDCDDNQEADWLKLLETTGPYENIELTKIDVNEWRMAGTPGENFLPWFGPLDYPASAFYVRDIVVEPGSVGSLWAQANHAADRVGGGENRTDFGIAEYGLGNYWEALKWRLNAGGQFISVRFKAYHKPTVLNLRIIEPDPTIPAHLYTLTKIGENEWEMAGETTSAYQLYMPMFARDSYPAGCFQLTSFTVMPDTTGAIYGPSSHHYRTCSDWTAQEFYNLHTGVNATVKALRWRLGAYGYMRVRFTAVPV
jgi:hypothetical protein